ncbi:nuclear transport factor 2 family protein [Pseudoalteromonas luteoviolacea]|uniref:DUF4440 domain-containing protein n=1 Tax=Pseudoalteromonas luteoviolacea H33 TaxID=1365251 RepID=A0A167B5F3_9GAMM|nr:DUF4440 domain-containing protein [Pseudoalteromonas luteoviolacea]KZN46172.1 hypothetical protein N476_03355 [Pseudoalteromonas luteoviolacea H33]KZN75173.1 hypothetical protein N477_20040 [Pseudoalteromonas luteoviolacea H33-S]MBQ4875812.1 DUF4440 domain-containing protein [Pseudoalteromonas luteoviolacea]MBQ4904847.1 DUF4440 domain-containing protein [Pseudoalteromonas luteoviolacea]
MTQKITQELLDELVSLERLLLEPHVRESKERLSLLLDDDFYEISANGLLFDKRHVLARLPCEKVPQFYNQDFRGQMLSETIAQLTYHAAYRRNAYSNLQFSLRMSLWRDIGLGWRLLFHQGTPCPEFALRYD